MLSKIRKIHSVSSISLLVSRYIAAAKVGDVGTSAGAGTGKVCNDKGYITHIITDKGVSATITAGIIRVKQVVLKNKLLIYFLLTIAGNCQCCR